MANFIGRLVDVGLAKESSRGTGVVPSFWLPKTNLTFNDKADKVVSEESLGVLEDAHESHVVQKYAEGDIEGEIGDSSFGLLLYNVLGSVSSAQVGGTGVYDHTFTIAESNQHQSLSIAMKDPNNSVLFRLAMLNSLTVNIELGQIVSYQASFMSRNSADWTLTASYSGENKFVATHGTVKIAAALADLTAASPIASIKSATITFNKNLMKDQDLGTATLEDIFNQQFSVEGSLTLNYDDHTYKDYVLDNTYKAMRIDVLNAGVNIGTGTDNPELQINMPRVHFYDWQPEQSNDNISTQTVNFKALYDVENGDNSVSSIVLSNLTTSY